MLTVAVVAARHVQNHHVLAPATLQRQGSLSGALSASRFNRRPHQGLDQRCPAALPLPLRDSPVRRRARLGGLLHDYYRDAA
jgi:hypothetical protein